MLLLLLFPADSALQSRGGTLRTSPLIIHTSGPQPFWHQGQVLWKTVFLQTGGEGESFGIFQMHYLFDAFDAFKCIIVHFIVLTL